MPATKGALQNRKKKKNLQTKEGICITQKIGTKQIQN